MDKYTKFILTMIAIGLFLNAFATPIGKELFATKDAKAASNTTFIYKWPDQPLQVYIVNK